MNDYETQEQLLQAWLEMSVYIRGNRILSDLSFNEIMICGMLYQQHGQPMSATEIGERTRLLKSQVNHVLNAMEDKGLICRTRSQADRRVVQVTLQENAVPRYLREHKGVLDIMNVVCEALGMEQARELADLMHKATDAVTQYEANKEK